MTRWFTVAVLLASLTACQNKDEAKAAAPPAAPKTPAAPKKDNREEKPAAQVDPSGATMAIVVDGQPAGTWTVGDLAGKVGGLQVEGDQGDGNRNAWSLRQAAETLVGPGARVTAVTGEDGTVEIDEALWKDTTKVPVLRTNRRGMVKFLWATPDGKPLISQKDMRNVGKIEVKKAQ